MEVVMGYMPWGGVYSLLLTSLFPTTSSYSPQRVSATSLLIPVSCGCVCACVCARMCVCVYQLWRLFLRFFHLLCFLSHVLSLAWRSPHWLYWLITEVQGSAHLCSLAVRCHRACLSSSFPSSLTLLLFLFSFFTFASRTSVIMRLLL